MDEKRHKLSPAWMVVIVLLASTPLYVLSSGPAFWLFQHRCLPHACLRVYRPVHVVMVHSEPFRRFMWDYLALWDDSMRLRSDDPFAN
jgi:hypothetical protein